MHICLYLFNEDRVWVLVIKKIKEFFILGILKSYIYLKLWVHFLVSGLNEVYLLAASSPDLNPLE